jgi:plasmid stability protein
MREWRCGVAPIPVRDAEDDAVERLRQRTSQRGHSVVAKIRDILRTVA